MRQQITTLGQRVRKTLAALRYPEYRGALRRSVLAATEHQDLLSTLDVDLVIDVGANRGQFSTVVRKVFPAARLVAFEPLAPARAKYTEVLGTQAQLIAVALGAEPSSQEMYKTNADDSSSLLRPTATQVAMSAQSLVDEMVVVEVRRLDDCVSTVGSRSVLLKIDVQGYELEVLRGADQVLRHTRYVYVEASTVELYEGQALVGDVINFLHPYGYRLVRIESPSVLKRSVVQADFLLERVTATSPPPCK